MLPAYSFWLGAFELFPGAVVLALMLLFPVTGKANQTAAVVTAAAVDGISGSSRDVAVDVAGHENSTGAVRGSRAGDWPTNFSSACSKPDRTHAGTAQLRVAGLKKISEATPRRISAAHYTTNATAAASSTAVAIIQERHAR